MRRLRDEPPLLFQRPGTGGTPFSWLRAWPFPCFCSTPHSQPPTPDHLRVDDVPRCWLAVPRLTLAHRTAGDRFTAGGSFPLQLRDPVPTRDSQLPRAVSTHLQRQIQQQQQRQKEPATQTGDRPGKANHGSGQARRCSAPRRSSIWWPRLWSAHWFIYIWLPNLVGRSSDITLVSSPPVQSVLLISSFL